MQDPAEAESGSRRIAQPGRAPAERIEWAEASGRRIAFDLAPGELLLEAVRDGLAAAGFGSGALTLRGGALGPLAYVMPALSPTARHAAFYSAVHRPPGACRMRAGAMTFGVRNGMPFFHCHGLWTEPEGQLRGGHVLPEETRVAETIRASGVGLTGAAYSAAADEETNFTLFRPVPCGCGADRTGRRLFALRLRPNQDVAFALEGFCSERGLTGATLHGGVGSIIGARFVGGHRVDAFATELAIRSGRVARGPDGGLAAALDVALVDFTGAVAEGRLVRGDNPVLMTLEVVVEPIA